MPLFTRLTAIVLVIIALPSAAADLKAMADRDWLRADSAHFSVITDQPDEIARKIVNDLEAARFFHVHILKTPTLVHNKPLKVVAIGSGWRFRRLGLPENWAGVFILDLQGYAALANVSFYNGHKDTLSAGRAILLHEYQHHLMRLSMQTLAYPQWYSEGMADYMATMHFDGEKVQLGNKYDSMGRQDALYRDGRLEMRTRELFNQTDMSFLREGGPQSDVGHFYSRAFFAVHYFNSSPALRAQLADYVRMVNLGYRQDRAAQLAFKRNYDELDRDITAYLTGGMAARVIATSGGKIAFPVIDIQLSKLERPAAYAFLVSTLPRLGSIDREAVRSLVATNLELNPDDPDAHVARLLYDSSPNEGALVSALAQRFPGHAALMVLQGDRLRQRAAALHGTGGDGWQSLLVNANDFYRRALARDADMPAAFHGLGMSHRMARPTGALFDEGVFSLDSASIYLRSPGIFRSLADLQLQAGKPLDALPALRSTIAFMAPSMAWSGELLLENLDMLADLGGTATAVDGGMAYPGGSLYSGPVRAGRPEGKGRLLRVTGSYFEGNFVGGLPQGAGELVSDRGFRYLGQFHGGYAEGQGSLTYLPGRDVVSYEGQFARGRQFGRGVLVTPAGRYEGAFADGELHGEGRFTGKASAAPLQGRWLFGNLEWPVQDNVVFIGEANAAGQRHGKGYCKAGDAAPVSCEYQDGKRR